MANNRMFIRCKVCIPSKWTYTEGGLPKGLFFLAKYYPSTGWYPTGDIKKDDLAKFFDDHIHSEGVEDEHQFDMELESN